MHLTFSTTYKGYKMPTHQYDWFGTQSYARVPRSILLDSRLGPRQFKLLCLLCLHAGKDGIVWPGHERLAEMLGHFKKDGTPNKNLVSKLISWAHADKSPGLGLVQLGYVQKLGWIANRETQSYRLLIANVEEKDMNNPTSRKMSDADFAQKRQMKVEALAAAATAKGETTKAQKALVLVYEDDEYSKNEVHNAYLAGELYTLPRTVVEYFGYRYSEE